MILYSFYWAKTAFVSLLLMISSMPFEATCSGSVSALFNSLIDGITSANEGEHSATSTSNQRPLELKLADAQMLQQWIGQIARKIVVEDGIFAEIYSCGPNININDVILTDGLPVERIQKIDKNLLKKVQNSEEKNQFLKLLFSFGAMLSAEIGDQSQQNGTLRALLKAYECVGGQFKGISDFVIGAVIKSPIEQLKVDKIILEKNNRRHIQEFALLNTLNIEMTPKDVINFASFIHYAFLRINTKRQSMWCDDYDMYLLSHILSYPTNPFNKFILERRGLNVSNLGKDPVKSRRIAHQLLLHLKNWGPEELEELSLKNSYENVIELTQQEQCFLSIFTRNLMQRMDKFELSDDYFVKLKNNKLFNFAKIELEFYERFSAKKCSEESHPFFNETIRIDWNVWKEIIQQIDELSETVKSKHTKKELTEYLTRARFNEAMQIIRTKFSDNEFGLKLKAEVKKMLKLNDETMPKDEIVNQFCLNLAKIRQICEEKIEQYEREILLKRNVRIKQKENNNKFYDFMAIFVEHFEGNWIKNDNEESIEFDLNGAKSFLEKLHNSATHQIVKKNESDEYECLPNLNFETAIRAILDKNLNEKAQNLLKEFYVPKEFVKIPPKSAEKEGSLKHFLKLNVEAQLFNLLFSFAARLEAIVHGKNIDGTIEESQENPKDKIRAFLAVPNCFNVPEWANKLSIFDYWMEIKEINSKESQIPVIGVAIFRKIYEHEEAKSISRENYKTLKSLNEYKFSIYESTKLFKKIFDEIEEYRFASRGLKIPEIITNSINQIESEIHFKRTNYAYGGYIKGCEFVKLFQNVSANFMKMKGIDVTLHMDELDFGIQAEVGRDFKEFCKIKEKINHREFKKAKIELLNNVRYDLVVNFTFNAWKDAHDITEDLLEEWTRKKLSYTFVEDEKFMMKQIYDFISDPNRVRIFQIEALKGNENGQFNLLQLFDKLDELVRKIINEEMPNLEKAKKELKTKKDEVNNLEKELEENKESALKMWNRLGQMLEEMKKDYGQKMDKPEASERMELLR